MKGSIIKEPSETQILRAKPLLAPSDYHAIGLAVTQLSWLESSLQHAILIHEIGTGTRPNEIEHAPRYRAVMRMSFRQRAALVCQYVEKKSSSTERRDYIESLFRKLIGWRDFLCHGCVKKLADGRLHARFWDRKSFNEKEGGYLSKTFTAADIVQLATSSAELTNWILKEFEFQEHKDAVLPK